MRSSATLRVELMRDALISAHDVGGQYPQSLVLEINGFEIDLGFGYSHSTDAVETIDRLIGALNVIRKGELAALAKPVVADIFDSAPEPRPPHPFPIPQREEDDTRPELDEGPTGIAGTGHH